MSDTASAHATILKSKSLDPLFTPQEAADYIGGTVKTLAVWRCTGRYAISYLKVGRSVRYRKSSLDAWLESRTHGREV